MQQNTSLQLTAVIFFYLSRFTLKIIIHCVSYAILNNLANFLNKIHTEPDFFKTDKHK